MRLKSSFFFMALLCYKASVDHIPKSTEGAPAMTYDNLHFAQFTLLCAVLQNVSITQCHCWKDNKL